MRRKGKLAVCTVLELAELLAGSIDTENVKQKRFQNCDFAIIDEDDEDIEYLKSGASGWYGVKKINTDFNSDTLDLIADYYGGGSLSCVAVDPEYAKESFAGELEKLIISAASARETLRNTDYIFAEVLKKQNKRQGKRPTG